MDESIEFILCDFSKEIGDTVYSPRVYAYGHDEFLKIYTHSFIEKTYFVINNITVDEKGRKPVFVNGDSEEWIEGIGSTKGLFWYYLAYLTNGQTPYPHLKCMKYNDEVMYLDNWYASCESCFCLDQITVGIEEITTGSFSISSSKLGIRIESECLCLDCVFELYDLSGVLVLSQSLTELETFIALENLPQGVYLYLISDSAKNAQTGKIILQ